MALIGQSDLEARLGRSLTGEEISAFTIINNALQVEIEKIIGSKIESVNASTRYFDGGLQHLPIDPCTSLSSVTLVDDDFTVYDTLDTTDYTREPINNVMKTMIRHRSGPIQAGINNIGITAKFSIYEDTDILNIVKDAMLNYLVAEVTNSDNIKRESIEGYSIEYGSTEAKDAMSSIKELFPRI